MADWWNWRDVSVFPMVNDLILSVSSGIMIPILFMENGMSPNKSLYERFFHALLFESFALLLCAPLMSILLGVSFAHAGLLTVMISLIAMSWNMIFNSLFERCERHWRWQRTFIVRLLHAVTFEAGLILAVVPLAAWWLNIGLVEAFVLDIGLILFFLPYTLAYNWGYDKIRVVLLRRSACKAV